MADDSRLISLEARQAVAETRLTAVETKATVHDVTLGNQKDTDTRIENLVVGLGSKIEAGLKEVSNSMSWERRIKDFAIVLCLVVITIQAMGGHIPTGISLPMGH